MPDIIEKIVTEDRRDELYDYRHPSEHENNISQEDLYCVLYVPSAVQRDPLSGLCAIHF